MSYVTELSNNMRQSKTGWESRMEEAIRRWNHGRASIIAAADETKGELTSRMDPSKEYYDTGDTMMSTIGGVMVTVKMPHQPGSINRVTEERRTA
jgi:hypothetical protein